jgi:hypothetical protein
LRIEAARELEDVFLADGNGPGADLLAHVEIL